MIITIALSAALYATFLPSQMSSRANSLSDPANGLTVSSAVSFQSKQETVSAATTAATQVGELEGSSQSSNLSATNSGPVGESTVGANSAAATLRSLLPGSTTTPTTSSSQPAPATATATPLAGFDEEEAEDNLPPCEESDSPLYCVYTVGEGDNLGIIAGKFNIKGNDDVTSWELLVQSNRPDIVSEDDLLQIGQKLRIPLYSSGVVHTVLSTQTLGEIADRYGVEPEDIMAVAANGISDANSIRIGMDLIIPNPTRFNTPAPALASAPSSSGSDSSDEDDASSDSGSGGSTTPNSGPRSSAGLMWPVGGPISSYYGPSHPLGIDIDLFSSPNAPIGAAAAGTVTFAGGNACCSYGYYVIIDHGNGIQTLYAHNSTLLVSVGEYVSAGEIIAYGGSTGYSTGNHLHFEVHVGGSIANPLEYLP